MIESILSHISIHWIDVIWIPIVFAALSKGQRIAGLCFVVSNMIMMRLMVETMNWIGYPNGLFNILPYGQYFRGLLFFSGIYALYMVYARLTAKGESAFFLVTSLSLIFAVNILFAGIMVL